MIKKIAFLTAVFGGSLAFTQCTAPPPGTVVFDGDNDADAVVMDYHGIEEDDLEGYKIIKIETQSVRNPQDTTSLYIPDLGGYANFQ